MTGGWGTPSWMGGDPVLGEVFVGQKTPEVARDLLAAAASLDLDTIVVRTVTNGFIVPEDVYEAARQAAAERGGWDL